MLFFFPSSEDRTSLLPLKWAMVLWFYLNNRTLAVSFSMCKLLHLFLPVFMINGSFWSFHLWLRVHIIQAPSLIACICVQHEQELIFCCTRICLHFFHSQILTHMCHIHVSSENVNPLFGNMLVHFTASQSECVSTMSIL